MANPYGREVLRGVEEETLDFLFEALASEQWAELLHAPLRLAARRGKRGLARKLVRAGAEMGDALHEAVLGGYEGIANDLLEGGTDVNARDADDNTPLHIAAREGKPAMVSMMIVNGADKDALDGIPSECTPLYLAVCGGHVAAAEALMVAGANIGLGFNLKESIVEAAARTGNVEMLRAVIAHGADVSAADNPRERTALHVAAMQNDVKIVDVLVDAGANIEAGNYAGATPLHYAATNLRLESLLVLLKRGADVNAETTTYRDTPLRWAAKLAGVPGAVEVVDALLRWGADETIVNTDGNTAADVVGSFGGGVMNAQDVERVRKLLVNAPADRAWRRRGYLALCRAHPDRMQLMQKSCRPPPKVARKTRRRTKMAGTEEAGGRAGTSGDGTADGRTGGDWSVVVAMVLKLQEEVLFRTIVEYL